MTSKKELRKKFSEIREAASDDVKNLIITAKVLADERVISADTVLLYASFRSEVSTWQLAEALLKKNIPVAFPRCEKNGIMTFHVITDKSQLSDPLCGIPEPDEELPSPVITDRTVCIVPALAFTESGERLGYGGGYYDRFLSANKQIHTIGLAFEACITDKLPTEAHDIRIKRIITEERTVFCNAE